MENTVDNDIVESVDWFVSVSAVGGISVVDGNVEDDVVV